MEDSEHHFSDGADDKHMKTKYTEQPRHALWRNWGFNPYVTLHDRERARGGCTVKARMKGIRNVAELSSSINITGQKEESGETLRMKDAKHTAVSFICLSFSVYTLYNLWQTEGKRKLGSFPVTRSLPLLHFLGKPRPHSCYFWWQWQVHMCLFLCDSQLSSL